MTDTKRERGRERDNEIPRESESTLQRDHFRERDRHKAIAKHRLMGMFDEWDVSMLAMADWWMQCEALYIESETQRVRERDTESASESERETESASERQRER